MTSGEVVSLKEYVERRFEENEKARQIAFNALEKRLDGMNEFRHQLDRQAGTFVTKTELDLNLKTIKDDKRANIALWLSIMATVIGAVSLLIKYSS